ncbi:hypothetical protein [Mangrovibacterium lignilyticum]|uniref:hypothetical protein n=1 Tax=Mangrovibacterium lignilyticum TaxID=2668052 RepID=UPI0013D19F35|nr:hypothetical protein [Mangrovibacterium lignilyticum]
MERLYFVDFVTSISAVFNKDVEKQRIVIGGNVLVRSESIHFAKVDITQLNENVVLRAIQDQFKIVVS